MSRLVNPHGSDEVWNGLALCKNHHHLFDKRILLIDAEARVRVDEETIELLRQLNQIGGYHETIGHYQDRMLDIMPKYFNVDAQLSRHFLAALRTNFEFGPAG